jgi:cell growth-regulating nucleolar protein
VTEVERYEKPNPNKKKVKVTPQELWTDLIASSVDSAPAHLRGYMESMTHLANVPRKEKQFRNFTSNSLNLRGNRNADSVVGEIWGVLKGLRDEQQKAKAELAAKELAKKDAKKAKVVVNTPDDDSSVSSDDSEKKDAKKAKVVIATPDDDSSVSSNDSEKKEQETDSKKKEDATNAKVREAASVTVSSDTKTDKKSVKKAMKKVLKKSKDLCLTLKHLRKAVGLRLGTSESGSSKLKKLVKQNLEGSSKQTFVLKGKTVTLQID